MKLENEKCSNAFVCAVRGLREYLKELEENEDLTTELLEVGDGLTITRKK